MSSPDQGQLHETGVHTEIYLWIITWKDTAVINNARANDPALNGCVALF